MVDIGLGSFAIRFLHWVGLMERIVDSKTLRSKYTCSMKIDIPAYFPHLMKIISETLMRIF